MDSTLLQHILENNIQLHESASQSANLWWPKTLSTLSILGITGFLPCPDTVRTLSGAVHIAVL